MALKIIRDLNEYLRKFLHKYVVNDRRAIYKRDHTSDIQNKLTFKNNSRIKKRNISKWFRIFKISFTR